MKYHTRTCKHCSQNIVFAKHCGVDTRVRTVGQHTDVKRMIGIKVNRMAINNNSVLTRD